MTTSIILHSNLYVGTSILWLTGHQSSFLSYTTTATQNDATLQEDIMRFVCWQFDRAVMLSFPGVFPPLSPSPYQASLLPSLLPIPTSLSPWLVPRGRCLSPSCTSTFFHHHFSCLVSSLTFQNLNTLPESNLPADVSVCLDFCSLYCAQTVLADILQS